MSRQAQLRLRNRKQQNKLYEMLFNLTGGKDYCLNNYLASVPQCTNVEKHKPKKPTNMTCITKNTEVENETLDGCGNALKRTADALISF